MAELPAAAGMEKVVCPPDRHIPIPVHDLVESLMSARSDTPSLSAFWTTATRLATRQSEPDCDVQCFHDSLSGASS